MNYKSNFLPLFALVIFSTLSQKAFAIDPEAEQRIYAYSDALNCELIRMQMEGRVSPEYYDSTLLQYIYSDSEKKDLSNFSGADLTGLQFPGANLIGIMLNGANLSGANLKGSNFYHAHLEDANLNKANLNKANLTTAFLNRANFENANLKKANLETAMIYGTNFKGANLKGANLEGADLENINFSETILADVKISRGDLWQKCPRTLRVMCDYIDYNDSIVLLDPTFREDSSDDEGKSPISEESESPVTDENLPIITNAVPTEGSKTKTHGRDDFTVRSREPHGRRVLTAQN